VRWPRGPLQLDDGCKPELRIRVRPPNRHRGGHTVELALACRALSTDSARSRRWNGRLSLDGVAVARFPAEAAQAKVAEATTAPEGVTSCAPRSWLTFTWRDFDSTPFPPCSPNAPVATVEPSSTCNLQTIDPV
jgi:hypothetical protein